MTGEQPIRVGIAGLGRSGYTIHLRGLAAETSSLDNEFRVVAVADALEQRRAEATRDFGVRAYADYRELIAAGEIDLLVCALPNILHAPASEQALRAGLHVICEKPIVPSLRELDHLQDIAAAHGKTLYAFQNYRFQPYFEQLQVVLESGVLGRILRIQSYWGRFRRRWDWQVLQANSGGVLYNTGPHAIDQALTLAGWEHDWKVNCQMTCCNSLGGDADDHCVINLHAPNSSAPTLGILLSDYQAYPPPYKYIVQGSLGGLTASEFRIDWRYFDPSAAPQQTLWPRWSVDRKYCSEELPWQERHWSFERPPEEQLAGRTIEFIVSYGVEKYYRAVHAHMLGRGPLPIQPFETRRQLAIIESCFQQNELPILRTEPTT